MKIPIIKKVVEEYTVEQLMAAEQALLNEQDTEIEIDGEDEGEKLTHIFAALWILNQMHHHNCDFNTALREYTKKVRSTIS